MSYIIQTDKREDNKKMVKYYYFVGPSFMITGGNHNVFG